MKEEIKIIVGKSDKLGLIIDKDAMFYLATKCQPRPKGAPKGLKRLIRIRANIFRNLEAFNKEIKRHRLV